MLLRRFGVAVPARRAAAALIFLVATMALGPGLIVNLGLKDHAHRPRPVQYVDFGGADEFRPGIASTAPARRIARSSPARPRGFLDGRAGDAGAAALRSASALAVALAFGAGAEPAAAGFRRPLPLGRAARRADFAARHRRWRAARSGREASHEGLRAAAAGAYKSGRQRAGLADLALGLTAGRECGVFRSDGLLFLRRFPKRSDVQAEDPK